MDSNIIKMAKGRFITTVSVISGSLGVMSDIAQPLAPFSSWLMAVSAITLLSLFITKLFMQWGEKTLAAVYLSAFTLIVSGALVFSQHYLDSSEQGVIATKIPEVLELQKILGITEEINKNTRAIAKATESIDKKIDNVKKETSIDPRKELANLGLMWRNSDFREVIYNNDLQSLELYLKGGKKLDAAFIEWLMNKIPSEEAALLIYQYKAYEQPSCKWFHQKPQYYSGIYRNDNRPRLQELNKAICKNEKFIVTLKKNMSSSRNSILRNRETLSSLQSAKASLPASDVRYRFKTGLINDRIKSITKNISYSERELAADKILADYFE